MRKLLLFFTTTLLASTLFAQERIYGVWEDQGASNYKFVSIDVSLGVKNDIAVIPGMWALATPNQYCIVQHDSTYVVMGMVNSDPTLFHIDVATGAVLNQNVVSDILTGFQYNCQDSLIYAIFVDGNNNYMVNLDPTTGLKTVLFSIPNMAAYSGGSFSLNPFSSEYSFLGLSGANYSAFTCDLSTQLTTIQAFDENLVGHVYSQTTDQTHAMWEDQINGTYNFMDYQPSTASFSTIGIPSGVVSGFIGDAYSHDDVNGLYNFMGYVGANLNWISLDMTSGAIAYANPVTDYVYAWGQLYGLCSPPVILDTVVADFVASNVLISPVDCIDFTDLSTGSPTSWQWVFSGGNPATSIDQNPTNICYPQTGCWDVTLIVSNANSTDTLTMPCYIDVETGIAENELQNHIQIYPQPANDFVTFEMTNGEVISEVKLFQLDGKLVYELNAPQNKVTLDRSQLAAGIYMYELILEDGRRGRGKITLR